MDTSKTKSGQSVEGMKPEIIEFLFSYASERASKLTDINKAKKFFKQGGHLNMEKADDGNKTKWFEATRDKGFLEAMDFHRDGIGDTFSMKAYDKWRISVRYYRVDWGNVLPTLTHDGSEPFSKYDVFPIPQDIKPDGVAYYLSDFYGRAIKELFLLPNLNSPHPFDTLPKGESGMTKRTFTMKHLLSSQGRVGSFAGSSGFQMNEPNGHKTVVAPTDGD